MMYGFGDDKNAYTESVDLLEDLVIEFITEAVTQHHFTLVEYNTQRDVNFNFCILNFVDPKSYGSWTNWTCISGGYNAPSAERPKKICSS